MTGVGHGLHRFLSGAALAGGALDPALLGLSWIGLAGPTALPQSLPCQQLHAPCLLGEAVEAWTGAGPTLAGSRHGVRYRHDGGLLFGVIEVAEDVFVLGDDGSPVLQRAAQQAYEAVFRLLGEEGYPHLWRIWNYLPHINRETDGLERYRQFNIGRHCAFEAAGRLVMDSIPAASALGVSDGPLSVAFLAGRTPTRSIENPRQLSAFRYPADYGPCSPTFSRAALGRYAGAEWLFVSGTASIVGHQSMHPGDPEAQTRELLANLDALLAEASRCSAGPAYRLPELSARVYVRHPEHLAPVQAELARGLGGTAQRVYLQADVCRADLLVEVEAQACHLLS